MNRGGMIAAVVIVALLALFFTPQGRSVKASLLSSSSSVGEGRSLREFKELSRETAEYFRTQSAKLGEGDGNVDIGKYCFGRKCRD